MSCCGRSKMTPVKRPVPGKLTLVTFEYAGVAPLTLFGRATGIRYHFPGPGSRVRVDARDAAALDVIVGLGRVTG
jgi:hypothetical protein